MRDTSQWSYTPTNFTMTQMVSLAVLVFMVGVAFMFWLGGVAGKKSESPERDAPSPSDSPTSAVRPQGAGDD